MPRLSDLHGLINEVLTYGETAAPHRIFKTPRKIPGTLPEPGWNIRSGLPEPGLGHVAIEDLLPTGIGTKLATLVASLAGKGAIVAGAIKSAAKSNLSHNPEERALAFLTAQRNAAKPVSEGGLGLRPDNTAAERAAAMGFNGEGYHYSRARNEIGELDPLKNAKGIDRAIAEDNVSPYDFLGSHVGTKEAARDRIFYNRNVGATYPVKFKNDNPLLAHDDGVMDEWSMVNKMEEMAPGLAGRYEGISPEEVLTYRNRIFNNNSNIPYHNDWEDFGSISHVVPPENIRSRFAAFDPAKRGDPDLLGYADPRLLGLIAGGTAGGIALNQLLQLNGAQR